MDPVKDKNLESSGSPLASVSNGMDLFKRNLPWIIAFALALLLVAGYRYTFSPPSDFPSGSIVSIARGASAAEVSQELASMHLIKHPRLLRLFFRISGTGAGIHSGAYLFQSPENLFVVTYRLLAGAYGLPPVRLTFIEGATTREMADQVGEAFLIPAKDFSQEARQYEGYLFPDTYLFPPSSTVASIVATMRTNFTARIAPLMGDIQASGHSLSDTVIVASLVEKEARTTASRRIVAGILWNRLAKGMPLQVDAVFGYIFNRDTYSPSFADLKTESPYNLYLHKGLPPGPISNPGLDALDAAVHPTKTDYLYYLTGFDELMHYATTYAGHQANQKKYLK
ncbi:MAG: endolytic transglycosylase MltG [Candidatus Paceibacterota bacterium]|jgi:UPF0755 protein